LGGGARKIKIQGQPDQVSKILSQKDKAGHNGATHLSSLHREGGDQEDHGLRPAQAKCARLYLKNNESKEDWRHGSVGTVFTLSTKTQYCQKEKKAINQ
jgi:hypothetical protein